MKKLLAVLFAFACSIANAQFPPYSIQALQADVSGTFFWGRFFVPTVPTDSYIFMYDGGISQPKMGSIGSGLSWNGTTLSATASTQVNTDWTAVSGVAQILNKPSTFPPSSHTHDAADIVSGTLSVSRLPSLAIAQTTGLQAAIDAKLTAPDGTTAQYIRGDGSLATLPAGYTFDYGFPAARTLAVSTSYQASNPAKAAVITPSYSCTNATTVLAASACTLQVRMHTSAVTCSTGTVIYTQSLTVGLGLLITQASTNPVQINLPIGAHFIICPTAGTFTVATVEQTVG